MKLLSLRAYAKHRGTTHEAVRKAIEAGRISTVTDEKGKQKIDPEQADKQWGETTDPAMQRGRQAKEPGGADPSPTASNFQKARTMREAYLAKIAQITYEEKVGKLVDAEQVKKEAFEAARMTRDAILNIPDRIASELASETDPKAVHTALTKALNQALEELANAGRRRAGLQ